MQACVCMCPCVRTRVRAHRHGVLEHVAPFTLASVLTPLSPLIQVANKGVDSQPEGEGSRPSMDLFKAIFASSSDEKSSSSEDEQGDSEDDQEGTREDDFKSPQETDLVEPSSVAQGMSSISDLGSKKENRDVSREAAPSSSGSF